MAPRPAVRPQAAVGAPSRASLAPREIKARPAARRT
ncbi:MAG: hypothetical protein H6Q11_641, partial [Acidobacteria bacterium]|nr:hypothetical protein [Acidobacteriota bacterium]